MDLKLFQIVLDLIEIGKAKFVEQDHSKATYAKKINKEEAKINWNKDALKIIATNQWFISKSGSMVFVSGGKI